MPIVAVTANALDQQIVEGRHAGMVEHLVKPFTAEELLTVVERVARRDARSRRFASRQRSIPMCWHNWLPT